MLCDVLANLVVLMISHQLFLLAWKLMLMCVISISITQFLFRPLCSQPSPAGGAHLHSSVTALLARLSPFLHRFRAENGEPAKLPQPSRPSVFHPHALFAHLSSLIHHSPPGNGAPDEIQQPPMPSRLHPHLLLARISSLLHRY